MKKVQLAVLEKKERGPNTLNELKEVIVTAQSNMETSEKL